MKERLRNDRGRVQCPRGNLCIYIENSSGSGQDTDHLMVTALFAKRELGADEGCIGTTSAADCREINSSSLLYSILIEWEIA